MALVGSKSSVLRDLSEISIVAPPIGVVMLIDFEKNPQARMLEPRIKF